MPVGGSRRVSVGVDADISGFRRGLSAAAVEARGFAQELESADGRMANLIQTGLALAPALVPIGAVAVPAIAGLTTDLGFAALAAGTAALAFHGVGDALTALDAYKLKPTAENFTKLQQALDKLGPAGQEFVLYLDQLEPKLKGLQSLAEAGLLPGVEDGLNHVLNLLPQVKDVIFNVSSTLGDLTAEAGAGLDSSRWRDFFTYLDTNARPILTEMGRTVGNLAGGFASLIQAFDPMSRSFSAELLDMSAAFEKWADGLSQTQGFHDFLDYIEKSGPRVASTLGSLANALVQIVEAAAPVGSVSLVLLKELADALALIADSPVGPIIIGAAAAIGVLGRSLALLKAVGLRGDGESVISRALGTDAVKGAPGAYREAAAATKELALAEKEAGLAHSRYIGSLKASSANLELYGTTTRGAARASLDLWNANGRLASASERAAAAEAQKSAALRGSLVAGGKAAAVVGGLALATSGLADKTGLSNTASMALTGTIAGPWGAAIGGGVGLVMDLAHANDDAVDATNRLNDAFRQTPTDINALESALASATKTSADYRAGIDSWNLFNFKNDMNTITDLWTHTADEGDAAVQRQAHALGEMKTGLTQLHDLLKPGEAFGLSEPGTAFGMKQRNEELTQFAQQIAPAAARAGIDLQQALQSPEGRRDLAQAVRDYNAALDSATGKSKAVGAALRDLGSQMESDVTQASALKSAMDSLFGVELTQSQATDAWITSLKSLEKQIKGTAGQIRGSSQAALDNRAAIRDSVQALEDKVNADAAAGVSGRKLVTTLTHGARAIEDQGVAAGVSRGKMHAYLATLGLTPKNLKTIITTPGLLTAKQQVQALGKLYGLTPKEVRTLISQPNIGDAKGEIDALTKKYNLTPKEVRTLLRAIDQASGTIDGVRSKLQGVNGYVATAYVRTIQQTIRERGGGQARADGGEILGQRYPYGDKVLIWGAPGEQVITNRHGEADQFRADVASGRIPAYGMADGGKVRHHKQRDRLTREEFRTYANSFDLYAGMSLRSLDHELDSFALSIRKAGGHVARDFGRLSRRARSTERAYDREEAALKKATDARDKLLQERDAAVSSAQGAFTSDIYSGSISTLSMLLGRDTTRASMFNEALKSAAAKGLSGGLAQGLAASGNTRLAQQFAGMSPAQIAAYEKQYAARQAATAQLGQTTASFFAPQIAAANAQVAASKAEMQRLTQTLNKLEKAIERGAFRTVKIETHENAGKIAREVTKHQRHHGRG